MSQVKLSIVFATTDMALSSGITEGILRVNLNDSTGAVVHSQDVTNTSVEFTGVEEGEYTLQATRYNSAGEVVGQTFSSALSVHLEPPAVARVPSSFSFTIEAL